MKKKCLLLIFKHLRIMKKLLLFLLFTTIVKAQIVTIPDANFKAKLLADPGVNQNNNGEIELWEAQAAQNVSVINSNIHSIVGIDSFTNLFYFDCSGNVIDNINISNIHNLIKFSCTQNNIVNLNLGTQNILQELNCSYNQIQTLNLSSFRNLLYLDCGNNQPLTSINIKNGNPNYIQAIDFSSLPNLAYVCADADEVATIEQQIIQYGVQNTCTVNSYCSFTPGGIFYTIQGNNKIDINNNGCSANDPVFSNLKLNITNGTTNGSLISNNSGNYTIPVQTGTHTITPQFENPTFFNASPASATVTFPTSASPFTQNFCITPNGVHHDLEIVVIPIGVAVPGFDAKYKIKYKNKGNLNENATISFNYNDAILDYVTASVVPNNQNIGNLTWNIGSLALFQSGEIIVTLNLNSAMETPAVNANDMLTFSATNMGLFSDETPDDNSFNLSQVVFNSFDPNDKTCLEGEALNSAMIGKYVHYKIKFENTGTFPAQNIVVKDIIDTTKFDISTLQMTDASHSCTTRISDTNKVEFIFENINLPFDDANNDGYVVFKIKTIPILVVGSTISNSANIYFDYNFPIVTNTATSTFQTLVNNSYTLDNNIGISPIPTKDTLTISIQNSEKINSISIYNMLGQVIQTIIGTNNTINVSELKAGDYIIKIATEKGTISRKIIKE